jgi:hypothetical protein
MMRLLLLVLACLLIGCQKKNTVSLPADDHFDTLTGKGTERWKYVQTKEDLAHLKLFSDMYTSRKNFLSESRDACRVPKIIHFIWIGPRPFPRESVENVRTWMARHPEWTCCFWTDRDRPTPCPGMQLRRVQSIQWAHLKHCYSTSDNFGEKSDLLRYEILYREGGVYVDHDVACMKAFDPLNSAFDFYCGIDMPYTSSLPSCIFTTNNLIGSKAGHPILQQCMESLAEQWEKIAEEYPGGDRDAMLNRTLHRTFYLFGEAVKACHNKDENRDIVLPAYFFDAPNDELALYARHKYAGLWHEKETPFEKKVGERLMYLSKKSNKILLCVGVLSGLNLLAIAAVYVKLKKKAM